MWLTTFQLHNLTDLDDSPPLFTNSVKAGTHPSCFHAVFVRVNLTWLFKIGRSTKTSRCPILGGTGFLRVYREKNKEGAGRDSLNRLILRGAGFQECRCLELSLYITKSHVTVRFSLFFIKSRECSLNYYCFLYFYSSRQMSDCSKNKHCLFCT